MERMGVKIVKKNPCIYWRRSYNKANMGGERRPWAGWTVRQIQTVNNIPPWKEAFL